MDNKTLNVGQQSLLGYLPAIVIQNILDGKIKFDNNIDWKKNLPQHYMMHTVALFADISGFTKLGEAFAKKGRIGPEFLAFSLNRYMEQLINIIGKNGGDVFKFAGDALLVIWPESKKNNSLAESCQRAIQCALEIQLKLHNQEIAKDKRLSIKVGIGVGEITILVVGGQFRRCEYLSVGEAMALACECETKALGGGETICHENVKNLCNNVFEYEEVKGFDSYGKPIDNSGGRFYKIHKMLGEKIATKAETYLMRSQFSNTKILNNMTLLKSFVPAAIVNYLDIEKESFSKEIRVLSIMFLNLSIKLEDTRTDEGVKRIQNIINCVQRCIYRTRGALNKFLMDDKGSVLLCCWGVPPMSSSDDHTRAVLTGLSLMKSLKQYNCGALMGITTGSCFSGVVGAMGGRREYSLLGGVVNCSARFMQKAIEYAISKQLKYQCLIDETTKDLVQGKIVCEYMLEGKLKGFANDWLFYEPKISYSEDKTYLINNPFPDIRTLKNNVPYGKTPNGQKDEKNSYFAKKSLFMVGRKLELEGCMLDLEQIYRNSKNEIILVKGVTGSGKSHFVRRLLWQFLDINKDVRIKNATKFPLIFSSNQLPTSFSSPLNAWRKTVKKIYDILKESSQLKYSYKKKFDGEKYEFNCDAVGQILIDSDSYSYINYINEILDADIKKHFDSNLKFENNFIIADLPPIDNFFEPRKFNGIEKCICNFFTKLITSYHQLVNSSQGQGQNNNISNYPLIFVLEDCNIIDEISIELIRQVRLSGLKAIGIICTYQEPVNNLLRNPIDKFYKLSDLINAEKEYFMQGLLEESEVAELIKFHVNETMNVTTVDHEVIKILIKKSFKGIPIFIIDLVEALLAQKYIQYTAQQLITTSDLDDMELYGDWTSFVLPIRFEKILGNIIDCLSVKEIMILKYAAVIGNVFDLSTLNRINPFNNLSLTDTYAILTKFESIGLLEFLNDFTPKTLICKFSLPFFNVVLYQRMLIEQKNEIHLNIARCLQHNSKFSYMSQKDEIRLLNMHLKITEKSIINYMDEKDDDILKKDQQKSSEKKSFNINNLKIFYVKELCEKLKAIDLKLNFDETVSFKNSIQLVNCGEILKKSDKGFTWETRFFAFSKSKAYYWYKKQEYEENKMPLGSFDLKNLYKADIIPDYHVGSQTNVFCIQVSSWFKKELVKGPRSYYFSVTTKSDLYCWVIYLNFLRVKAIYDNFVSQFGQIDLPLSHERPKKKFKRKDKFKQSNILKNINHFSVSAYLKHSYNRKLLSGSNQSRKNSTKKEEFVPSRNSSLKRVSVFQSLVENPNEELDNQNKQLKMKSLFYNTFNYALISFFGCTMNIIFNLSSVGLRNDEKLIVIPSFLELSNEDKIFHNNFFQDMKLLSKNDSGKADKNNLLNKQVIKPISEEHIDNGLLKNKIKISEENEEESDSGEENKKKHHMKQAKIITFGENITERSDTQNLTSKQVETKERIKEKKSIFGVISDSVGMITDGIGDNLIGGFGIFTKSKPSKENTNKVQFNDNNSNSNNNNNDTPKTKDKKLEKKVTKSVAFGDSDPAPMRTKSERSNEIDYKPIINKDPLYSDNNKKKKEDKTMGGSDLSLNTSNVRVNNKNEFEKIPHISEKLVNLHTSEDEDETYLDYLKNGSDVVGSHHVNYDNRKKDKNQGEFNSKIFK